MDGYDSMIIRSFMQAAADAPTPGRLAVCHAANAMSELLSDHGFDAMTVAALTLVIAAAAHGQPELVGLFD
jgi:hypothetical protein